MNANLSGDDPKVNSSATVTDLHEAIRQRAEEIYVRSGRISGRDVQNWAQAEREIQRETTAPPSARRTAVVVRVNSEDYIGEYKAESSEGYTPGEFGAGAAVPVRFEGDKMFVRRPNGRELETRIVKKTT
ncbi:MAG: DUF2934 domain-containing protein [Candidatus Sulfotelmatobacter sp.]|jgi:hypothetical protein